MSAVGRRRNAGGALHLSTVQESDICGWVWLNLDDGDHEVDAFTSPNTDCSFASSS
jgi:hypothetical protein